jgi:hypothetical protein
MLIMIGLLTGENYDLLESQLRLFFARVACFKPISSRSRSAGMLTAYRHAVESGLAELLMMLMMVKWIRTFCCMSTLLSTS